MNTYLVHYGNGEKMLWNAENETICRNVARIYLSAWKGRGLIPDDTIASVSLFAADPNPSL